MLCLILIHGVSRICLKKKRVTNIFLGDFAMCQKKTNAMKPCKPSLWHCSLSIPLDDIKG